MYALTLTDINHNVSQPSEMQTTNRTFQRMLPHCSNGIAEVVRPNTKRIMGGKVQNSTAVCSQKMAGPQRAQYAPRYFRKLKQPNDYHAPETTATRQRVGSNANKLPTHEKCSTCCSPLSTVCVHSADACHLHLKPKHLKLFRSDTICVQWVAVPVCSFIQHQE